jgi:hypothetical protein
MSCNVICLPQYACGSPTKVRPEAGAVYAPFVKLNLGGMLTVGNKSFPGEPHTAIIKSLDYGGSTGAGMTIEIIDEQGTSFNKYFKAINRDICEGANDYQASIDFGWLARTCDGSMIKSGIPEGPIYGIPKEIESSYEGGVIKYTIKITDLMSQIGENRIDQPVGSEANRVRLKPAVRQLFSRNCPPVNNIRYLRRNGDNMNEWRFRNSDGGPEGPTSVWPADQQNALSVARSWFNSVTTDRRLGFTAIWNSGSREPELWFVEDTREYCNTSTNDTCVGTYIVNGGDCSPVISFSPQAKWVFSANMNSGGGTGAANSSRAVPQRAIHPRGCEGQGTSEQRRQGGATRTLAAPQNATNYRTPEKVMPRQQEAMAAHETAAQYHELSAPMEGELKVHGDPRFVHQYSWVGKKLGIIVINPFSIHNANGCEWIAAPMCNPIYSDKNWMIMGVSHQISEGSYTTTFKVTCSNVAKLDGDTF